jgi:hypothetical protein
MHGAKRTLDVASRRAERMALASSIGDEIGHRPVRGAACRGNNKHCNECAPTRKGAQRDRPARHVSLEIGT